MDKNKDNLESMLRNEYPAALENLRFSAGEKARMTAALEESARKARNTTVVRASRPAPETRRRPARKKSRSVFRHAAAAAAVVGALVVGGAAYAGGGLVSVANLVDDVFGGAPAKTEVVDKVGHPIGAAVSSNGVTVSADAILGDARNYAIVYSIAKDDGTAFEGIEQLEDGTLLLTFQGGGATSIDGIYSAHGSLRFYDADPTDNAVQMIEQMTVSGESAIGKTARTSFGSLVTAGEGGDGKVVAEGEWKLKFEIDYEDVSVGLPAGQTFELNGKEAAVETLSISPIALSIDYAVSDVAPQEDEESGAMSEEHIAHLNGLLDLGTIFVTFDDGSVVEVEDHRGGSLDPDGDRAFCEKGIFLPEIIDVERVASVTICGTEFAVA